MRFIKAATYFVDSPIGIEQSTYELDGMIVASIQSEEMVRLMFVLSRK